MQSQTAEPEPRTVLRSNSRRRFVRTTTGAIIAAALPLGGCEVFAPVPPTATAAWQPDTDESDPRRKAVSYAILAPNPHNRQPWLIDLSQPDQVIVRIDSERLLPHTDPLGRQILIGTGAMIGLLELAARKLGYRVTTELFPEQAFASTLDGRPVARIGFTKSNAPVPAGITELFDQILRRRTVRDIYDPGASPDAGFAAHLTAEAGRHSGSLNMGVISRESATGAAISELVRQAWKVELSTPRTLMESMQLLRIGASEIDRHRDGITITDPMLIALKKLGLFDRSKVPAPDSREVQGQIDEFNAGIDSTPAYFWLTTRRNERVDQAHAGAAYVKVQLKASAMNLVMHPLSQGLQEYPEMSGIHKKIHRILGSDGSTVQMLCRLGSLPAGQEMPGPAPRRGLKAHLIA